ncbi:methionine--tRNA ligase [Striga asiatica]|uniref:Methionine--tRNA ligase n=1 Tax=Striga asiatica TaxID=4170 RepID=A0A5A7QLG9_STRAF|nr:methionine--tRNA ligase [Striga asiatica]
MPSRYFAPGKQLRRLASLPFSRQFERRLAGGKVKIRWREFLSSISPAKKANRTLEGTSHNSIGPYRVEYSQKYRYSEDGPIAFTQSNADRDQATREESTQLNLLFGVLQRNTGACIKVNVDAAKLLSSNAAGFCLIVGMVVPRQSAVSGSSMEGVRQRIQFCLPSFHFQRVLRYEIRVSVALGRVRNPLTHATNASGGRTLAKERGSHGTHLRFGASYTRIAFYNSARPSPSPLSPQYGAASSPALPFPTLIGLPTTDLKSDDSTLYYGSPGSIRMLAKRFLL